MNVAFWRSQAAASDNQGPQWQHITRSRMLYRALYRIPSRLHRRTDRKEGNSILLRPASVDVLEALFMASVRPAPKWLWPIHSAQSVHSPRGGVLSELSFCAHRVSVGQSPRGLLAAASQDPAPWHHGEHSSPRGAARNGSQNAGAKRLRLPAQRHPHCGAAERLPGGDASR